MSQDYILETRQLSKEFKGFVAVDHVDLRVRRGSIHALIGPNGAPARCYCAAAAANEHLVSVLVLGALAGAAASTRL